MEGPQITLSYVQGSALRGQPDHANLQGVIFLGEANSAP